jgi:hypothetical protein
MEVFDQVKKWNLSVSLSDDQKRLKIHPWSTVTTSQKQWFVENKQAIIEKIKSVGEGVFHDSDIADGSFPKFLAERALFGDAVSESINEQFVSSLIPPKDKRKGCGCSDYAKALNQKGVADCIAERETIEKHLVEQSNVFIKGAKLIPNAFKQWQAKKIIDAAIEKTTPKRKTFADDVAVVTASDETFSRGLYVAAWSTIYQNNVNVIAYDLGINDALAVQQMQNWGVRFIGWQNRLSSRVNGWQTYNKPFMIRQAMRYFKKVIWIDADVVIGGDLSPVVSMIDDGIVVPDHGSYEPKSNQNADCSVSVLGQPAKQWGLEPNEFPCCGFLGFDSSRDWQFVDDWCSAISEIERRDAFDCFAFFDQGVFQHLHDGDLCDGRTWNSLTIPRRGSASTILKHAFENDAVVHHSGGVMKYWDNWTRKKWNDPNFVGSR